MGDAIASAPSPAAPRLADDLEHEVATATWDHRWRLTPYLHTPAAGAGLRHRDWTLVETIRGPILDLIATSPEQVSALIIGCGEGLLCHAFAGWGAEPVVGVEADPVRLRRAKMLARHYGLGPATLSLTDATGITDRVHTVVTVTDSGELDPVTVLSEARARTGSLCVICVSRERRLVVADAARTAGFDSVEPARIPTDSARRYVLGESSVLLARVDHG